MVRLSDDAFLVILANGSTEFVVVHGWTVLPLAPQFGDMNRVLDLEDSYK